MDLGTKRAMIVVLVLAAIGLGACVVRTAPTHGHRPHQVQSSKHKPEKHKKQKHKKHKKHKKHHKH